MALPGFPNPVNELSARLVALGVVGMALSAIAFDLEWMTLVLAYGFVARVIAGPRFSPLALIVTRVVTPALPVEGRLVPGPPKRFAQAIGATLTVTAVVAHFGFGLTDVAFILVGLVFVAATLESVFAFCIGCQLFGLLMRIGVIPDEICERCNNLGVRSAGEPVLTSR